MTSKKIIAKRSLRPNFSRWIPREKSSWAFQIFSSYNSELSNNIESYFTASKFVYSTLKLKGAAWTDKPEKHFPTLKAKSIKRYKDLQGWSNTFNDFDNWANLNALMSISSTFEIYFASIVTVAIQSDPGVLLGSPKSIDGVYVLKHGALPKTSYQILVDSCTKGDWNSRITTYEKLFGTAPRELKSNIITLEAIRKMRNDVGHAFGRDINESRKHGVKLIIPVHSLSRAKVLTYQKIVRKAAKAIDAHLLTSHIGEFQSINFYHSMFGSLRKDVHQNIRAGIFKKDLGKSKVQVPGKGHCIQLVGYYESL